MTKEEFLEVIKNAKEDKRSNLNLTYKEIKKLPPEIADLTDLTTLYLGNNKLEVFPLELVNLANLNTLHLGGNKLTSLPSEIGQLVNLRELYISHNSLKSLPPEIGQLVNLRKLYINYNSLTSLPPGIGQLINLAELDLGDNGMITLSPEIGQLKNLTKLCIGGNKLTSLPPDIGHLTKLTEFNLYGNELNIFPKEIKRLTKLTELNLGYNKLGVISPEIGRLSNLKKLDFGDNALTELPPEIKHLENIVEFYLAGNRLTKLPCEIGRLNKLTTLNLYDNKLTALSSEIGQLTQLTTLTLRGNPLKFPPPEIVSQGTSAIKNYLLAFKDKKQEATVFEAKLIVVGQGSVGKTCLCKRLLYNKYSDEEPKTKGIAIGKWKLKAPDKKHTMTLNVWDFAGQEIYHGTHQFFLTERSVYLLVWDTRQEDEYGRLDYWLHTISAFGGNSPILLILNKCDEHIKDINLKELKDKFPQIHGFYRISCKDPNKGKDTFEKLKEEIANAAWNETLMEAKWIDSWLKVRGKLEGSKQNQIDYSKYLSICSEYGIEKIDANILSNYLHDLGVILHFKDDILLKTTVILKPEWGTGAVYRVLEAKAPRERNGILITSEDLNNIWKAEDEYPPDKHPILLELMSKFEISFKMVGNNNHIVAELLPVQPVDFDWNYNNNLCFIYAYSFMPAGIMPRFIVRIHENLERHENKYLCWKEGALITYDDTRAYVKATPINRKIEVKVTGRRNKELLAIIRNHFDHINKNIHKVEITKKIPCNCTLGCTHLFDYDVLCRREYKGITEDRCDVTDNNINISKLLNGVETKETRQEKHNKTIKNYEEKMQKPPKNKRTKIFISYSHEDKEWLTKVQKHLKVLKSQGIKIDVWDDTKIKAGDRWKEEIEKALATVKIAVILITTDFLASDFITNDELPLLLKAVEDDGARVIPILVKPSIFKRTEILSQFQAIHDKPLSKLKESDQDEVLVKLTEEIEDFLK